jgi:hypothetical protein
VVDALKVAHRIGSGLLTAPGIFSGFKGINIGEGRKNLIRFLNDCPVVRDEKAALSGAPTSALIVPSDSDTTSNSPDANSSDALFAKHVAQNFHLQYKKAGIAGMRYSVESCYALARKTLKESTIEYCYLLDQLARCSVPECEGIRQTDPAFRERVRYCPDNGQIPQRSQMS